MTKTDRSRFATILIALTEMFGKEISDAAIEMYFEGLSDLSIEEFTRAAGTAVKSSKFMPSVAELLDHAGKGAKSRESRAMQAWTIAWDQVSSIGAYRSPRLGQVTTRVIHAMGGWAAFCRPEEDETWHRKRFCEIFESMDGSEGGDTRPLLGEHDAQNAIGPYRRFLSENAKRALGVNEPKALPE